MELWKKIGIGVFLIFGVVVVLPNVVTAYPALVDKPPEPEVNVTAVNETSGGSYEWRVTVPESQYSTHRVTVDGESYRLESGDSVTVEEGGVFRADVTAQTSKFGVLFTYRETAVYTVGEVEQEGEESEGEDEEEEKLRTVTQLSRNETVRVGYGL